MHRKDSEGKTLLTIAIPTYNRAAYLELGLRRLGEELDVIGPEWRKKVKVIISNNASTDDTAEILARDPNVSSGEFEVVNNAENVGGERNVAQCYAMVTSPYVWILGDDDVILPGGLKLVLEVLHNISPDIVYVENFHFKNDYQEDKRSASQPAHREQCVHLFEDAEPFMKKANVMLTFISAIITKNKCHFDYHPEWVAGRNLPQLGWVLPLLREGRRFVYIEHWIIAAKGGNSGGYGLVKVFGEGLMAICNHILNEHPTLLRAMENGAIINFFPGFVFEWRQGKSAFDCNDIESEIHKIFGRNWRYYIFILPIFKLPLLFAHLYKQLVIVVRPIVSRFLI